MRADIKMSNVTDTLAKLKSMQRAGVTIERESTAELENGRSVNGWLYDDEAVKKFKVEENPFPFLFVDLTYRCNMACNICYNPVRPSPDLELAYFDDFVKRLPSKTEIRLIGGEPTIHPEFLDFVDTTLKYGHNVYVSSNGKKIADDVNFAKEIKKISSSYPDKMRWHMDMSGGKSEPGFAGADNKFYNIIHGEPAYEEKIQCLENLREAGIGRVTLGSIIIRDLNEDTIPDMFSIAEDYQDIVREIAFRSQGRIGRFIGNEEPYYTNDWKRLLIEYNLVKPADFSNTVMAGYLDERCGGKNCCFHYKKDRRLSVSWIDFLCQSCWMRGQIVEGTDDIEYMFESLQVNDFNKK